MDALIYGFYNKVANEAQYDGEVDYDYVVSQLHNDMLDRVFGPVLGPPLPLSMLDRMLRAIYAPTLRAQLESSAALMTFLKGRG